MKTSILKRITRESSSIADICRKLNVSSSGDQHKLIKKVLKERNISFSHMLTGVGANKGRRFNKQKTPLSKILIENSTYQTGKLKSRLLKEGKLKEICSKCKIGNIWNGEKLVLQLEHKNGKRNDHRLKNLELLCPNCHTQTKTWGNKTR